MTAAFERAEALAFAGRFVEAEALMNRHAWSEHSSWLTAYIAGARGDFSTAERTAALLAYSADDRKVRHRASLTLGSVLRQTERHAEAVVLDRYGLELAADDEERAHALVGLGADAIGLGEPDETAARAAEAAEIAPRTAWRAQVRIRWVRCELGLLTRDTAAAVGAAREAVARSRASFAVRHEAKSLLFLGAALEAAGDPEALIALRDSERLARSVGAEPVEAVARRLREGLEADAG